MKTTFEHRYAIGEYVECKFIGSDTLHYAKIIDITYSQQLSIYPHKEAREKLIYIMTPLCSGHKKDNFGFSENAIVRSVSKNEIKNHNGSIINMNMQT